MGEFLGKERKHIKLSMFKISHILKIDNFKISLKKIKDIYNLLLEITI